MKTTSKLASVTLLFISIFILNSCQSRTVAQDAATEQGERDLASIRAKTNVLTQKNDKLRTGANLNERILNTSNVNSRDFGMVFKTPVDGQVYTQPLVVSNLRFPDGSVRDVVYVGTMHNSLYAIDANSGEVIWKVSLGTSVLTSSFRDRRLPVRLLFPFRDIEKEVGILSTPVIDLDTKTIFVLSMSNDGRQDSHKLHAIDLVTHEQRQGSPVTVEGSAEGKPKNAVRNSDGVSVVKFDSHMHLQRPSLALDRGQIILGFASHGDMRPFHGWLFAYDASTLKRTALHLMCPNSDGCGYWQSGQAPAISEDGSIFLATGNGFKVDPNKRIDRPNSVVRFTLDRNTGFEMKDFFTPANSHWMDAHDYDLGVSGTMLIPNSNSVIAGSKIGYVYNLKRDNLGGYFEGDGKVHQLYQAAAYHVHAAPVFWRGNLYIWSENDYLKAYGFDGNLLTEKPVMQSEFPNLMDSMPGGMLSISAKGDDPKTGIVWANLVKSGDANRETRPGTIHAFDASNLRRELWTSEQVPERDSFGNFAKFTVPTIANGKVYVSTFSNQIVAYGLLQKSSSRTSEGTRK